MSGADILNTDGVVVTLEQQVASVIREIGFRERCYPGWVDGRRMLESKARHELAAMRAVLVTLKSLQENRPDAQTRLDERERNAAEPQSPGGETGN